MEECASLEPEHVMEKGRIGISMRLCCLQHLGLAAHVLFRVHVGKASPGHVLSVEPWKGQK